MLQQSGTPSSFHALPGHRQALENKVNLQRSEDSTLTSYVLGAVCRRPAVFSEIEFLGLCVHKAQLMERVSFENRCEDIFVLKSGWRSQIPPTWNSGSRLLIKTSTATDLESLKWWCWSCWCPKIPHTLRKLESNLTWWPSLEKLFHNPALLSFQVGRIFSRLPRPRPLLAEITMSESPGAANMTK